jgi:RHS repeat-associated protein
MVCQNISHHRRCSQSQLHQIRGYDSLGNDISRGAYSPANEETPFQGGSGYDAAGNMTTLQSGKTAKYDAWNRLAEVDNGSTIVAKYKYDGTGRRIQIKSDFTGSTPGTVQDDYYLGQQVIETRFTTGGNHAGGYQYLWSQRYVDAPIMRDTLMTDWSDIEDIENDSTKVYYLSDANYNVTGLVKYESGTDTWKVAERYTYNPYGLVAYHNTDWSTATSSANNNTVLYTGRTLDLLTGLYYYRARYYDAGMGRFINRDPIAADVNLYRYCRDNPLTNVDPTGSRTSVTVTRDRPMCIFYKDGDVMHLDPGTEIVYDDNGVPKWVHFGSYPSYIDSDYETIGPCPPPPQPPTPQPPPKPGPRPQPPTQCRTQFPPEQTKPSCASTPVIPPVVIFPGVDNGLSQVMVDTWNLYLRRAGSHAAACAALEKAACAAVGKAADNLWATFVMFCPGK